MPGRLETLHQDAELRFFSRDGAEPLLRLGEGPVHFGGSLCACPHVLRSLRKQRFESHARGARAMNIAAFRLAIPPGTMPFAFKIVGAILQPRRLGLRTPLFLAGAVNVVLCAC